MTRVGFVGIGNMGSPMAGNLARKGFAVTAYDKDASRAERFAREHGAGCTAATAPRDLASVEALITMLPTGADVRRALLEDGGGIAAHLPRGTLVIDMSSSDPVGTRSLGGELESRGLVFMDAPVSGAVPRAHTGTLAIMIGSLDRAAIERARPILLAMGERLFEVGPLGAGHAMKGLNNFLAGTGFAAACEVLLAGKRFGLDPATMIDVLNVSSGRSWVTELVMKEQVIEGKHSSGFALGLLAKDVKIAADLAAAMHLDAPVMRLVSQRWADARDELGYDSDNTAAIRAWDHDL
ncbi:MAG TPA: NAD(P)-dependent oxidoreductase [Steroidobacteraceae bacterium]|nr:NAD(P)-dependent oxidoreductase [Steroidobacteraceae bacterium]